MKDKNVTMLIAVLKKSCCLFFSLMILTGVIYPLIVTEIAQYFFPHEANGSLVSLNGKIVGSSLLAQKFVDSKYFWPRPSAIEYNTLAVGASSFGPNSIRLREALKRRADKWACGKYDVPLEYLSASASGLDPHITPGCAVWQLSRVAEARGLSYQQKQDCRRLIDACTEPPQYGLFGPKRVNVLLLNLALDRL